VTGSDALDVRAANVDNQYFHVLINPRLHDV